MAVISDTPFIVQSDALGDSPYYLSRSLAFPDMDFVGNILLWDDQIGDVYFKGTQAGQNRPLVTVQTQADPEHSETYAICPMPAVEYSQFRADTPWPNEQRQCWRKDAPKIIKPRHRAIRLIVENGLLNESVLVEKISAPYPQDHGQGKHRRVPGINNRSLVEKLVEFQGFKSVDDWVKSWDIARQYVKNTPNCQIEVSQLTSSHVTTLLMRQAFDSRP